MITLKELAQQAVEETQIGNAVQGWAQSYTQKLFTIFSQTVKENPTDWEQTIKTWMHEQAPSGDSKN